MINVQKTPVQSFSTRCSLIPLVVGICLFITSVLDCAWLVDRTLFGIVHFYRHRFKAL